MSINSALYTGVSGLVAQSSALAAISDNIANANTVGYKTVDTQFGDIVTGNNAAIGNYDSGGVLATTQQLVTQQGDLQQTSSNTDLAISGSGFFVTTASADPTVTDARNFTRAGSFVVAANGDLQNAAGGYLQGWPVNADGTVTIDPSSVASLQTINVSGAGTKPDFTISIPVSDSQGGQRTLSLDLLKSSTADTWSAELVGPTDASGNSEIAASGTQPTGQIAAGTIKFNTDGSIDTAASTLTDANGNNLFGTGGGTLDVDWASSLGVTSPQPIKFNLTDTLGGLTQVAATSVTQSVDTDGTQFGNLTNVEIDKQGFVTAVYDNGVSRKLAQVALATFQNPDGLTSVSGDNYQVSAQSGTYNLKAAGTGGAGTLSSSSLEASTVDLSQQFAGLIVTQQAYAASTKILTTADQLLQQLISIKQ